MLENKNEDRKSVNLIGKLAEITNAVERIPKNGYNDFHKYYYALESDIKQVVREELAKRNLILISNEKNRTVANVQAKNGTQQLVTLEIEFTIYDADSDKSIVFTGFGDGQDSGDKAVYKAKTGAIKYALTSLFLIPTGDDPEKAGKPLQPQNISADQVQYLDDLVLKVANLANENIAQVIAKLKTEINNMGSFNKYSTSDFETALRVLKKWEKAYSKRRSSKQEQNNQSQKNISWGEQ